MYIYVYICIYIYICIYVYMYIYIYDVRLECAAEGGAVAARLRERGPRVCGPPRTGAGSIN